MRSGRGIAWVLVVLFAGLVIAFSLWRHPPQSGPPSAGEPRPAAVPLVTTARPAVRAFVRRVPWIGTVEPAVSVELIALAAGRVEAFEAGDNERVEAGSEVARLGGFRVEGERARLSAEVESLRTRLELARRRVERLKESLRTHLATRDQLASAMDARIEMESRLREARLKLETFEKELRIVAPVSGTFTGRRVGTAQALDAGEVVGEIVDAAHLRVVASLFPPQGVELMDKEATVRLDENRTLSARIRSVLPKAAETGGAVVWLEGPQIDAQLRPGQTVGGTLDVSASPQALAVPESAVVYDEEERPLVFIRKNGDYEPRQIAPGLTQDGWMEVLSGVEPDETVVTQGAYELFYRRFNEQFKVED